MKGKIIVVDTSKKELPSFVEKNNIVSEGYGFIDVEVRIGKDEIWSGRIRTISTTGKYHVELLEKTAG